MKISKVLLLFAVIILSVNATEEEEDDFIIIEDTDVKRDGRQILLSNGGDIGNKGLELSQLGLTSAFLLPPLYQPCLTNDGRLGKCMSLKECYPYFKIPDIPGLDTWVMGLYDTCSYPGPVGNQVFGVCCSNDTKYSDDEQKQNGTFLLDHQKPMEPNKFTKPVSQSLLNLRPTQPPKPQRPITTEKHNETLSFEPIIEEFEDTSIFETKFKDVGGKLSDCGLQFFSDNNPKIVNGEQVGINQYPFMAALLNRNRQFCGGSLIDKKHILTAAHCVAHMTKDDVKHLRVHLGDHNIKSTRETNHEVFRVRRVIRHKNFSLQTLHNDVAILTLSKAVTYKAGIQPICLPSNDRVKYINSDAFVAGWGTLKDGGRQSSVLLRVDVNVWKNKDCAKSYGSRAPGGIKDHMLCASKPGKDSCSGDSGGPLFICNGPCKQIGIVSWGIGCAKKKYPGVYTRVTAAHPWIEKIRKNY